MRIVPWTAMNAAEYQKIARHGISYKDERSRGFLSAYIEGEAGDVLIRDPRCLHGGTPNHASDPSRPDIYKRLQMPEVQKSLPRFGSLRQGYNRWSFDEQ